MSDEMVFVKEEQKDGTLSGNAFWYSDVSKAVKELKEEIKSIFYQDNGDGTCSRRKMRCDTTIKGFNKIIEEIFGEKLI